MVLTRRWFAMLFAGALLAATLPTLPAPAAETYEMYFPVMGANYYSDDFGAPRGDHTHQGNDIMTYGVKGVPVVAVAAGTVGWVSGDCCAMQLNHDDGWSSWYIHLNNDTPGTDDGKGWGFAPGIQSGVHVEAGQLIGFVGDSGNAEGTAPHLHFELHDDTGTPVNPYEHLNAAATAPTCQGSPANVMGTSGDDVLYGTGKADVIIALGGNDVIHAGNGKDIVCAGSGNDVVYGEKGQDVLLGHRGADTLIGGDGADTLKGHQGGDILRGGKGPDEIIAGWGKDVVKAGGGHDVVDGGAGADELLGFSGDDVLDGSDGDDTLTGGGGIDSCLNGEVTSGCEA